MRIVVIGAGIVGASIAEALALRGAEVIVLDMRGPNRGASRASAGMLAPYTEADDDSRLLDISLRSLSMFDALIDRLSEGGADGLEYSRTGTLQVAFDDDDEGRLQRLRELASGRGAKADWIAAPELQKFEPTISSDATGGLFIGEHGFVNVSALVRRLVDHARFLGAAFEYPVEAALVDSRKGGVAVRAGDQRYEADAVVIAPGSWARRVRVANVPPFPVRPIRGQLLHLRWTATPPPARIVWGPGCYCVPWLDGSVLVGATVEEAGFEEHATVEGVQQLTASVTTLLPASSVAHVEEVKVGLRPALPDLIPGIGPLDRAPGVFAAIGHYRHGVLLAPFTADVVVRSLLDGEHDPAFALTSPNRLWSNHGQE